MDTRSEENILAPQDPGDADSIEIESSAAAEPVIEPIDDAANAYPVAQESSVADDSSSATSGEPAATTTTAAADDDEPAAVSDETAAVSDESAAPHAHKPKDNRNWFVIHTYSGYENKVKANLERRIHSMGMSEKIFRVLVPMEEEVEFKDGKRKITPKKVFPGYVLVEMIMDDQSWYVTRNTQGVTGFVGSPGPGEKPVPLQEKEVKTILKQMGIEAPKLKIDFEKGDRVKVTSGPFFDFTGVVDEIQPEKERLRALISIFGRETPVELEFFQVEKV